MLKSQYTVSLCPNSMIGLRRYGSGMQQALDIVDGDQSVLEITRRVAPQRGRHDTGGVDRLLGVVPASTNPAGPFEFQGLDHVGLEIAGMRIVFLSCVGRVDINLRQVTSRRFLFGTSTQWQGQVSFDFTAPIVDLKGTGQVSKIWEL